MKRHQKELVVELLKDGLSKSESSFLVGYRGLSVAQMQNLRRGLKDKGASLQVAKWRLMKLAADGTQSGEILQPFFRDQIAIVFASKETPAVAKVLSTFSKENEALLLVAGSLENALLDADAIKRLVLLPSKEVLLGQVCGTLKVPITRFVNVMNVLVLRLLWTLKAVADKKQG